MKAPLEIVVLFLKPMEHFIYILYSLNKNKYYIGYTADIEQRLIRHNQKSKGFTGSNNDWKIVYKEKFYGKLTALKRETDLIVEKQEGN